jgi:hypothetical protein
MTPHVGRSIHEKRVKAPTIFEHLFETYRAAEKSHPDLMEPFAQAIVEAEDREAEASAMRHALAVTFRGRYPMPAGCSWPEPQQAGGAAVIRGVS